MTDDTRDRPPRPPDAEAKPASTILTRRRLLGGTRTCSARSPGFAALEGPTLTVADATRLLMNGAEGGNLADVKPMRTIAAGTDPVALDTRAKALPGNAKPPQNLPHPAAMGPGRFDCAALSAIEIPAG